MPLRDQFYHQLEIVAASHVCATVQNHLPPFRTIIQQELAAFDAARDSER